MRVAAGGLAVAVLAIATTSYADSWVLEASGARVEASGSAASDKAGGDSGPIKKGHDEIVLRGGSAMLRDLAPLLGDAIQRDCPRNVNANLIAVGGDGNEAARMSFAWAIVTELSLPAFDGSTGPASEVTLKLEPQFPKRVFQKGPVAKPAAGPEWKKSGFKLAIDGLDASKIKALGELKITQAPSGGACGAATISDLTFSTSDASALTGWRDAKNGVLDYVAADGSPLLKVKLNGLKKKSQTAEGGTTKVTASIEAVALGRK